MKRLATAAGFALTLALWGAVIGAETTAPVAPRLLSETGSGDARNRPFSPQYPLWSDGAGKRRWIQLPEGKTIDTTNIDRWDFPVGTKFWKEFEFGGKKVETRFLWKVGRARWVFASYAWNAEQTEAVRAPESGIPRAAEVAPGKWHTIPGVADCRACHDSARTEILGFNALQLSTDRDPLAQHAEPLSAEMVTLATLVSEQRVTPARPGWITAPPRIETQDARTRAALGYLSTNCGSCHNTESTIASLGISFRHQLSAGKCSPAMATAIGNRGHWVVPTAPEGESQIIHAGRPDLSALIARARSRRGASQMPPIGTVIPDREGIELLSTWVESLQEEARPLCQPSSRLSR